MAQFLREFDDDFCFSERVHRGLGMYIRFKEISRFCCKIHDLKFQIQDFRFKISDFEFQILNFRFNQLKKFLA